MLLTTVLDGLNQGELRDAMQQWWRTLVKEPTLEQLEDMLYQKQQQQGKDELERVQRQVALTLAAAHKGKGGTAKTPASAGSSSSTPSSSKGGGKHTMHPYLTDDQVRERVSSHPKLKGPPEKVYAALRIAMKNPSAPDAACALKAHDISTKVTPHTNAECQVASRSAAGGAAGGTAAGSSGQYVTPQQLEMLRQEQHNTAAATQQLMAAMVAELSNLRVTQGSSLASSAMAAHTALAAMAAQGRPHQVPKYTAQQANQGRGTQQQGLPSSTATPCEHCGRPGGHPPDQFCYINDPARARTITPAWGPDGETTPAALHLYLQRCMQQGIKPRLRRAEAAFAAVMQ
jgi:hypothetical protein